MRTFRSLVLPTVAGAALLQAAQAAPTVTRQISPQEQAAASLYWTRARIATAMATPLQAIAGARAAERGTAAAAPAPAPAPGFAAGGRADPQAEQIARAAYWQDWASLATDADGERLIAAEAMPPGPILPLEINLHSPLWLIHPHTWMGRLTFVRAGAPDFCSATVIGGNNIVTAAHCVFDTTNNLWHSSWVFTPAYRNGNAPYGSFAATSCTILSAYVNLTGSYNVSTWTRHNVALCKLGPNSAGQTINGAVGFAGRMWDYDPNLNPLAFASGYPTRTSSGATVPNGPGQYLRACISEERLFSAETLHMGCSWGTGISGGSWLYRYQPAAATPNTVFSLTAAHEFAQPVLYGPRFSSSNIVVLCNAVGC